MLRYYVDSTSSKKPPPEGSFNLHFSSTNTTNTAEERPVVLFTDTEEDMLELYRMLVRRLDYDAYFTTSSEETLHLCQTKRVSLVVTDLNKPRMDGFELLATLRKHPQTSHIPVMIVSTVYLEPQDVQNSSADDYLQKPFDYEDLLRRIRHLVEPDDPLH